MEKLDLRYYLYHAIEPIDYSKEEYLNYGANYASPEDIQEENELTKQNLQMENNAKKQIENKKNFDYAGKAELHIIDLKEQDDSIYKSEMQEQNVTEQISPMPEKKLDMLNKNGRLQR